MVASQLRPQGVSHPAVVEAMGTVPREQFVAAEARPLAYSDRSVAVGNGRMMSSPTVLGLLLSEIAPVPGERALIVGAATGYSAAILKSMGVEAVALECDPLLLTRARELGTAVVEGPLEKGWKKGAPYDFILVDGAIEHIPDAIVGQLAPGGRLGTALVDRGISRLVVGRRAGDSLGLQSLTDAGTAALPGFARPAGFTF